MRLIRICIVALTLISAAATAFAGEVSLVINFPSISPDGDGIKDSFSAFITVDNPVDTVLVTIEDMGATQIYDTLFFMAPVSAGDYSASWDGTDYLGSTLPEGDYRLRLYEVTGTISETETRTVVIDTTAVGLVIDRIEPGVFSPGYPDTSAVISVYFTITGYEPGIHVAGEIVDPDGVPAEFTPAVTGDGEHAHVWKPTVADPSGTHIIAITITDEAGNVSYDEAPVILDTDGPEIVFVTEVEAVSRTAPSGITGYCYDASGVVADSLKLFWGQYDSENTYYETDPFAPDSEWWSSDTLYWTFEVPDSVDGTVSYFENRYRLTAKCHDNYERQESEFLSFEVDRTAPVSPQLDHPVTRVIETPLTLNLIYDETDSDSLLIYRVHLGVGTARTISRFMSHTVDLEEGINEVWVEAKDAAGNVSSGSAHVSFEYVIEAGITYPEAFRGPDVFQIITGNAARGVQIDIYDLAGESVRTMTDWSTSTNYEITWNLTSDGGETVRNGPYLLVLTIHYETHKTVEKSFIAVVK